MKRVAILLTAIGLMVPPSAGVALAAVFSGTSGNASIRGTSADDIIYGRDGGDRIVPGRGNDRVYAGAGNDYIDAVDSGFRDYIDCGPGFDRVGTVHRDDRTLSNCERTPGFG